jgi:hypothetical protein
VEVRELVTALFREIYFAELSYLWGGMNSAIKGGNQSSPRGYAQRGELPHSTYEFYNSQEMKS